jgi:glycosyl transferase family 87
VRLAGRKEPAGRPLLALSAGIAAVATVASAASGRCNNFLIFRAAYANLLAGGDLYAPHPAQHLDLFKYSPTFALLFAPFAAAPFRPALLAWNLLNAVPLAAAVHRVLPARAAVPGVALTLLALAATTDGTQSNGLVAALIVLAFLALERGRPLPAALAIAAGASIKLFPLAAVAFAALHRGRARFAVLLAGALAAAVALPLTVTTRATLAALYASWARLELVDAASRGASAMWLLHRWSRAEWPNWPVQLAATVLLLAPAALRRRRLADRLFRLRLLASVLVYAVLFNHQAERPSFVIALTGVAIWWAVGPPSSLRSALAAASFALVAPMGMAELAPARIPAGADPVALAVLPLAVAWMVMQAELLRAAVGAGLAAEPGPEPLAVDASVEPRAR